MAERAPKISVRRIGEYQPTFGWDLYEGPQGEKLILNRRDVRGGSVTQRSYEHGTQKYLKEMEIKTYREKMIRVDDSFKATWEGNEVLVRGAEKWIENGRIPVWRIDYLIDDAFKALKQATGVHPSKMDTIVVMGVVYQRGVGIVADAAGDKV